MAAPQCQVYTAFGDCLLLIFFHLGYADSFHVILYTREDPESPSSAWPVCVSALHRDHDCAFRSPWPIYWHKGNPVILSGDYVRRELNFPPHNHRWGKFGMKNHVSLLSTFIIYLFIYCFCCSRDCTRTSYTLGNHHTSEQYLQLSIFVSPFYFAPGSH